ncbi:S8 family serine peptidase [Saccharomonospora xinjiangensis]|uniref:S8 family peptidase n=1 Tax=Saccharomonospora xinjiangensis TaxID=75294 RepID=UPI0026B74E37
MRRRPHGFGRVAAVSAMAVAVATTSAAVTAVPAQAVPNPPVAGTAAKGEQVVTLVTGDKVVLGADRQGGEFVPAEGREKVGYHQYVEHGAVYVIPDDAAPLIAEGTLDRRLFNVTALVEAGYHDRARDDLPVLVSYREGGSPGVRARTTADGAAVQTRSLAAIGGAALETAKSETRRFWDSVRPMLRPGAEIERLWLDAPVKATLAESVPQIGADKAHTGGVTGDGVRVAVLDTGIDADHPDLASAVAEVKDFTGGGSADDGHGHGTHVAGTIAGDGTASGGRYRGVAPDAELVVGKVLDDAGFGQESWILAGMEWAAGNAPVVNMSLGGAPTDGTDPMSMALNRLTEETGALFVVAAGNMGTEMSVGSPGSADAALTVGAVTKDDALAGFSSRGPRVGDHAIKPDVTAPGADIVAARAEGTQLGEPAGDGYISASGTSMASPHVAGAAALLEQRHAEWDADELKAALMGSALAHPELSAYEQGAGRIDVSAALAQPVLASPPSLSLGVVEWPRTDDKPVRQKVTYTNTSDKPVTLDLKAELSGPDGVQPAGMITVEPAQVTVPAGGRADATVTVDTTVGGPDGRYSGAVTATVGDTTVRTPVGIEQEVESYDLAVKVLDRDGTVAEDAYAFMVRHNAPWSIGQNIKSGDVLRLPKDDYFLYVTTDEDYTVPGSTMFVEPTFTVDGDRTVVLDGRDAEPVSVAVDAPDAEMGTAELRALMETRNGYPRIGVITGDDNLQDMYLRPSETSAETFEFTVETEHARPDGTGRYAGSPYAYHLRHTEKGAVPDELTYEVSTDELAKVTSVHTDGGVGAAGERELVSGPLPLTVTDYYTPGTPWTARLWLNQKADDPAGWAGHLSRTEVFERGDNGERRWNTPVFGPAFPHTEGSYWAVREGDELRVDMPLHSDPGPGSAGYFAATGSTKLYRDGELFDEFDLAGAGLFFVPETASEYRLVTEADAAGVTPLSRKVSAEWTFRSQHAENTTQLPLLAVRFTPDLGDDHAAKRGEALRIPVSVQRNGEAGEPKLSALRIQVSFDGGASWKSVRHRTVEGERVITVTAPKGAKDVSLRAVAKDVDGNALKQTIIGAYPVR